MSEEEQQNGEPAAQEPPAEEPPAQEPPAQGPPPGDAPASEEELRARIEEGMRTVRVQDVVLESAVTIVNITARRIAKEDERDLEQARIGIEAVRGLVDLLDPEPQAQVRNALSELQMIYARASGGGDAGPGEEPGAEAAGPGGAESETPAQEPKKPDSGLWVPPGSA
jgi:hypothetical protein